MIHTNDNLYHSYQIAHRPDQAILKLLAGGKKADQSVLMLSNLLSPLSFHSCFSQPASALNTERGEANTTGAPCELAADMHAGGGVQ